MVRNTRNCRLVLVALGSALLVGSAVPASAHTVNEKAPAQVRTVPILLPQENVPTLVAGGPAQSVFYPPDNQTHSGPATATFQAPPHTSITGLNLNCYGQSCSIHVSDDGSSATVTLPASSSLFDRPWTVDVAASPNAPLAGGTFSGTVTYDGVTQPLTVVIAPGKQGVVGGRLRNTNPPGNGVRVVSVDAGTNTEASGLLPGDVITALDGVPTPTVNDLDKALMDKRGGATYPVTVNRSGDIITLMLTLDPEDY